MKYDYVVCGAGPAGISAAIALRKENKNVLLVENSCTLGGTNVLSLVGPLMTYHDSKRQTVGGFASDLIDRLIKKGYSLGHISDPIGFCETVTPVDTEGLKETYYELIDEYNIDLLLDSKVIGANVENRKIKSIKVANKLGITEITAKCFIDATGDGDLAYFSNCKYTLGRSTDNLSQPSTMPFVVSNVDLEKVKEAIKKDKNNFVLNDKYDFKYVAISGFFNEVKKAKEDGNFNIPRDRVLLFENVTKNEVTVNMTRVSGLSMVDPIDATKAELIARRQVKECFKFLKDYIPGFENSKITRTPYKIGVRESRHIECDYMITKDDVLNSRMFSDRITLSSFPMDIHSPNGSSLDVENNKTTTFSIPLKSIIAKDLDNLIVTGRCIGATHEASASLRVTPSVMALGEASGYLASLSSDGFIRNVEYNDLKKLLIKHNFIL